MMRRIGTIAQGIDVLLFALKARSLFVARLIMAMLCMSAVAVAIASAQTLNDPKPQLSLALPLSGPYRLLGEQFETGLIHSPLGQTHEFIRADTQCTADGGTGAAVGLAAPVPELIIGFFCIDALDAAQQTGALRDKTIIVPFTARTGQPPTTSTSAHARTIHIAPSPIADAQRLADHVSDAWRGNPIAIIDDGTLSGRMFADTVRARLAEAGIEPVYTTQFRPQLSNQVALARLLERSGATHIVMGGDRYDASVLAEAMHVIDYPMTLAGGASFDQYAADRNLPPGTIYARLPDFNTLESAAPMRADLNEAGVAIEGFVPWGYVTGELVNEWLASGNDTLDVEGEWQTTLGILRFDGDNAFATNLMEIQTVPETTQTNDSTVQTQ